MTQYVTYQEFTEARAVLEARIAELEKRLAPDSPGGLAIDLNTRLQELKEELDERINSAERLRQDDVRRLSEIVAELQTIAVRLARSQGGFRTMTAEI